MEKLKANKKSLIIIVCLVVYSFVLIFATRKIDRWLLQRELQKVYSEYAKDLNNVFNGNDMEEDIVETKTTNVQKPSTKEKIEDKVIVTVTSKNSVSGYSRSTDKIVLKLNVTNNTDTGIKGIQGRLIIKDMFGTGLKEMQCNLTGKTIEVEGSAEFKDLEDLYFFINSTSDRKIFETDLEDLLFDYKITTIVFTDGTTNEY